MHVSHPVSPLFFPKRARGGPGQQSPISGLGPGTMVLTIEGEMPVEWLAPGDRLLTRDNGSRPIVHITRLHRTPEGLPLPAPMAFLRGEIGPQGVLHEQTRVAPGHRGLIRHPEVAATFGCDEVLARFGEVSRRDRIHHDPRMGGLTYHLILMERHEIISAGALWVETTDPAMAARLDLPPAVRRNTGLLDNDAALARHCLSREEAKLIRQNCPADLSLLELLAA